MLVCLVMVLGSTMVTQAAMQYSVATEYDGLSSNIRTNCVMFARYMVPTLPYGLTSKADKEAIINSNTPTVGSIAITHGNKSDGSVDYDSVYGHVAYVESINGNQITTLNGGFSTGRITRITGTPAEQGVIGYWVPNGGTVTPPVEVSLSWNNSDCQYDTTNAYMYIEADTNINGAFTEAGITVWNEAGGVVGTKSENPGVSGNHLNVWYNLTNELGIVLQPGTNYKYQFHTVFNGKRYESSVMSFRTNGQAENAWTKELSIDNWVYGETAKTPSATAKYGTVVYTYSTEKNGTYTAEVPKNAGTYYVKATVAAVENQYTGLETVKEFKIEKATPQYTIPTELIMTYGERLGSIELPEGFEWYDVTELSGPVGERSAEIRYVPEDENNYTSVENIPVTVTVNAKDLSGINLSGIDKNTDFDKYQIKDGDTVLVKDTDYTISSVTKNDTVTVTVDFIGNYTGSAQTEYSLKDNTDNTGSDNESAVNDSDNGNQNSSEDTKNSASDTQKIDKNDGNKKVDTKKAPQTGDESSTTMWMASMIIAGGIAIIVLKRKKAFR